MTGAVTAPVMAAVFASMIRAGGLTLGCMGGGDRRDGRRGIDVDVHVRGRRRQRAVSRHRGRRGDRLVFGRRRRGRTWVPSTSLGAFTSPFVPCSAWGGDFAVVALGRGLRVRRRQPKASRPAATIENRFMMLLPAPCSLRPPRRYGHRPRFNKVLPTGRSTARPWSSSGGRARVFAAPLRPSSVSIRSSHVAVPHISPLSPPSSRCSPAPRTAAARAPASAAGPDIAFDACAPLRLIADPGMSDAESAGIAAAVALWNTDGGDAPDDPGDAAAAGAPGLPVHFQNAAPPFPRLLRRAERAGLHQHGPVGRAPRRHDHARDRARLRAGPRPGRSTHLGDEPYNLVVEPTAEDVDTLATRWGGCVASDHPSARPGLVLPLFTYSALSHHRCSSRPPACRRGKASRPTASPLPRPSAHPARAPHGRARSRAPLQPRSRARRGSRLDRPLLPSLASFLRRVACIHNRDGRLRAAKSPRACRERGRSEAGETRVTSLAYDREGRSATEEGGVRPSPEAKGRVRRRRAVEEAYFVNKASPAITP